MERRNFRQSDVFEIANIALTIGQIVVVEGESPRPTFFLDAVATFMKLGDRGGLVRTGLFWDAFTRKKRRSTATSLQ